MARAASEGRNLQSGGYLFRHNLNTIYDGKIIKVCAAPAEFHPRTSRALPKATLARWESEVSELGSENQHVGKHLSRRMSDLPFLRVRQAPHRLRGAGRCVRLAASTRGRGARPGRPARRSPGTSTRSPAQRVRARMFQLHSLNGKCGTAWSRVDGQWRVRAVDDAQARRRGMSVGFVRLRSDGAGKDSQKSAEAGEADIKEEAAGEAGGGV
eukprot:1029242-Pleurochrysis_carterae.AAC.1